MGINDEIADKFVGHRIDLQRAGETTRRAILDIIENLEDELTQLIRRFDLEGVGSEVFKRRRAEAMLKQARQIIADAYRTNSTILREQLIALSEISVLSTGSLVNATFAANILDIGVTRRTLGSLVTNSLLEGSPAADWWRKQSGDLRRRFEGQVRQGIVSGESNDAIIRRVRGRSTGRRRTIRVPDTADVTVDEKGTVRDRKGRRVEMRDDQKLEQAKEAAKKKGRRPAGSPPTTPKRVRVPEAKITRPKTTTQHTGGLMDTSKREASGLVRTAVQKSANDTIMDMYRENADVLKGVQAIVTLDTRTSEICISRSSSSWDLEGNPLPENPKKEPFPGAPPWHFNCRTVLAPITKSFADMTDDPELKKKLENAPKVESKRTSIDGQVPADLSYGDWLKTKSQEVQIDVLGKGKWKLWKDGKISLTELTDQSGRPLTLAELRRRAGL